jgi:arsenate reductase (thioredoxin)
MKTIGLFLIGISFCQISFAQAKKIVFVCEHGSAKSVIAATYFNKLAKENNLEYVAISRGTNPDAEISPKTKLLLVNDNLFDENFVPQKITQQDVNEAQQVILFYLLPETIEGTNKTRNWLDVQSVNQDYEKLRDDIVSRITPMVDSLAKR